MKTISSSARDRGFTLTETLTAVGLLSLALLGIVTLYAKVFSLLGSDRTLSDAAAIARKEMTMLSLAPKAAMDERTLNGIRYQIRSMVRPTNGLLYTEVIVSWETNGARNYTLATLIDTN